MRACQDLPTPTKKPGFYRISGLQSTIVVKNPVSEASPPSKALSEVECVAQIYEL